MKRICMVTTTLLLLTVNLIDAFQRVKPEGYANKNYGQDELLYTASSKRAYYQPSSYGYLQNDQRQQQPIEQQTYYTRSESFDPLESLQYSSLNNPNILQLNNGYDQLSKYKNYNRIQQQPARLAPSRQDLNKLLVSIQNIRPYHSDDYVKIQDSNQGPIVDEQFETSKTIINKFPLLHKQPTTKQHNYDERGNSNFKLNRKFDTFTDRQPVYREENMQMPYDEIEQQQSNLLIKKNQPKESKVRRTNQQGLTGPSSMLNSQHEHMIRAPKAYQQPINLNSNKDSLFSNLSDIYFIAIVACVSTVAIFSVIGAGYCFYKVQQSNKAAADVDFPAYGVIGPASRNEGNNSSKCLSPSNDRKLVQSAQIYHYHHQKQQMISTEKNSNIPKHNQSNSDIESDEENEDGEYTVYECPGLAPTGEMEIKNPLFQDDLTPMSSPSVNGSVSASKGTTPKNAEANKVVSDSANPNQPVKNNKSTE